MVTLLLGLAAVNTGNNLLYLLVSALLGFMAVSGLAGRTNIAALDLHLEVPEEIYDRVPTLIVLRLHNRKPIPAFLLRVRFGEQAVLFPVLPGRGHAVRSLTGTFVGRGRQRPPAALVSSIFPINFFVRHLTRPWTREVLVFPAPRPCRNETAAAGPVGQGSASAPSPGGDGEIAHITEYGGAEPLKRIHWKLSARDGSLKVKRFSSLIREPVLIRLQELPGNLEQRLGCACFLLNRHLRQGRPVGLQLSDEVIPPDLGRGHRLRLLTRLAEHDPHPHAS